jgi:hypothetical protein
VPERAGLVRIGFFTADDGASMVRYSISLFSGDVTADDTARAAR